MNARIEKLVSLFEYKKIDAILINRDVNIRYLTRYPACESWLFVTPKKAYYITDFRYIFEVRKGLKGAIPKKYTKSYLDTVFELAKKHKVKNIGIDERHVTLSQFKKMNQLLPKGLQFVEANHLVESLREVKDEEEVEAIRNTLKFHKKVYQYILKKIKPGVTEREVVFMLEKYVKSLGAEVSFPPIVASGSNSCAPHASVTERKIRNNEPVLLDMGIDIDGYKSDLTRMIFLGRIPKLIRRVNDIVKESQLKAISKIKSGIPCADIDRTARKFLATHQLARHFGHSLGHGIGLEVHESPAVSQKYPGVLKKGMVITVEPGVYFADKFGIRIEDMVLVTKNGCEILSDNIH